MNFFRRFHIPDNPISRGLLGALAREPYVEVVLREDPEEFQGLRFEFKFILPESKFAVSRLQPGKRAYAKLKPEHVTRGQTFWLAEKLLPVGR